MPKESSGLSLSKILVTIAVLIAAFLVIKFIFSALKWIVIGGLAVGVAWLFLKDDTPSSKSG